MVFSRQFCVGGWILTEKLLHFLIRWWLRLAAFSVQLFGYFETDDEYYFDLFFGFYNQAFEYLSDDLVIIGQRMILHSKNIVQPRYGVFAMLLGCAVFCQLLLQRSLFTHQRFDAWIGRNFRQLRCLGCHWISYRFVQCGFGYPRFRLTDFSAKFHLDMHFQRLQNVGIAFRCFQYRIHERFL